jgi:hypothetical protein
LNTYVENYIEDQEENMQQDDNFNIAEYGECREYEQENDDEYGNAQAYYIGPACTEDGLDIQLQLFSDDACQTVPEDVTFEEISNGWTLPYSDGGLVSTNCISCADQDDDGEVEVSMLCQGVYEDAGKCESQMEYTSQYGSQEGSCEYILEVLPASSRGGAGNVFGWFLFIVVAASFSGYIMWWKKKKAANNAGDGLMA